MDVGRHVRRPGAVPRTRLPRLHPAGRLDLCRRDLRQQSRLLPEERIIDPAPGALGGCDADGRGDDAPRYRADAVHLRLCALSGGAHGGHAGSDLRRARRVEHGDRQFRSVGEEFRHGAPAAARPALRHGRGIRRHLPAALGIVGTRGDRCRSRERRADRSGQGAHHRLRGSLLQQPRAAELGTLPARPAGDRPGRRIGARQAVRREIRRHDRGTPEG